MLASDQLLIERMTQAGGDATFAQLAEIAAANSSPTGARGKSKGDAGEFKDRGKRGTVQGAVADLVDPVAHTLRKQGRYRSWRHRSVNE